MEVLLKRSMWVLVTVFFLTFSAQAKPPGGGGSGGPCGDGVCACDESPSICSSDCEKTKGSASSQFVCGNGVCEAAEDATMCPADCGSCGGDPLPSYDPATSVVVFVHGFDPAGYLASGPYGDDAWHEDVQKLADTLGQPLWQVDPTAANHVAATTYYGDTAPSWYTADDIAADAAADPGIPRYALRVARYIDHSFQRAPNATAVNLVSASMGTLVARYIIEHDLLGLSSAQIITRWTTLVGVTTGNWIASNASGSIMDFFGSVSVETSQMDTAWIDANISAHTTMNSASFGHIIIGHWIGTLDDSALTLLSSNQPNDGLNLCSDQYFWGQTTTDALYLGAMPMKSWSHTEHTGIRYNDGAWAGFASMAQGNVRVTVTLTRTKALNTHEEWYHGDGEFVYESSVTAPMAATLYNTTLPINQFLLAGGNPPMITLASGQTKYPNVVMFDQVVPPGETQLNVTIKAWELDDALDFYGHFEVSPDPDYLSAQFTAAISTTGGSVTTLTNANQEIDLTTTITPLY